MAFIVSVKNDVQGLLLVVTDEELVGKLFEEGILRLDLTVRFYEGDEMGQEEVIMLLKNARHIHFTGKEAVALGINEGLIDGERVLFIQGVPHAQVVVDKN